MLGFATPWDGRTNRQKRKNLDIEAVFRDAELTVSQVCRRNPRYRIYIHCDAKYGLFRITLTDRNDVMGEKEGFEGRCVRQLYTYNRLSMAAKLSSLIDHRDPPGYCAGLIKSWNCDNPEGPISLDATPYNRAAHVPNQPPLVLYESAS